MSKTAFFSALHCPPCSRTAPANTPEKTVLQNWSVEDVEERQRSHPCFDHKTGVFTVPTDGLYSLIVQVIPIGGANVEHAARRRQHVDYALRLQEPSPSDLDSDMPPEDIVESEYLDVGSVNLGEVLHLRAGTNISCLKMPLCRGNECVRLMVEILQRKRKRPAEPELSKKELKKRKKKKRKAELMAASARSDAESSPSPQEPASAKLSSRDTSEDSDEGESDWSDGFESDTSEDELPHSRKGVTRLAKRFKHARSTDGNV